LHDIAVVVITKASTVQIKNRHQALFFNRELFYKSRLFYISGFLFVKNLRSLTIQNNALSLL
ncbi:hypothetical protein C7G57_17195, partial [Acinetobacter baumannii]